MKKFQDILGRSNNFIGGIPAAPGLVIGKAHIFIKEVYAVNDENIENVEAAVTNFYDALEKAKHQLQKILAVAREKMGEERASIFLAQMMVLDDEELINSTVTRIRDEKKQPEFVFHRVMSDYLDVIGQSTDLHFREVANDLEDIKNRVIKILQKKRVESEIEQDAIVISELLTPADTVLFSRYNAKGYITDRGGLTSHAAILARSLDIPAIVGTHNATQLINQDDLLIIDGFHGYVFVNPDEEQIAYFEDKIAKMTHINARLKDLKDKPSETTDGREISIFANIDVTHEIELLLANNARGIGLYRTEQMLEDNGILPDEEEQTRLYSEIAQRIYPRIATIRTFDIGGDKVKVIDYPEANPFLGLRGIRFLLENPSAFKVQLRAMLRANLHSNIRLMLPMVSTLEEIWQTKELIEKCKSELQEENIPHAKHMMVGTLVEVPSAALMIREIAAESDFISIGTNDLIQYLMAVDRGNDAVSKLYQEFHPAVLRTLKHILDACGELKKPVTLCGEMAADNLALPILIGLGLQAISVSPAALYSVKRTIRAINYANARELAEGCLLKHNHEGVHEAILEFFEKHNIPRTRTILDLE